MTALARLAFWRHMPRFSARVRLGLAALVVVLAVGDAVLVPSLLPKPDEFQLVIIFKGPDMDDGDLPLGGAFRLPHPAQFSPSGDYWLVDGRKVSNLTEFLTVKARQAPNHMPVLENYSVSLGTDPSYGRALAAFTKLAREGMCWGGIQGDASLMPHTHAIVVLYRNARGALADCDPPIDASRRSAIRGYQ